jgi:hypothetical protein
MATAVGVQRMMEVRDLPWITRLLQRLFDPRHLRAIHDVRIEDEEAHGALGKGVVALSGHVESSVRSPGRIVVVAKCRKEGNARLQQLRVWTLELLDNVLTAVQVVSEHDDELERKSGSCRNHLIGDIELRLLAGSVVADDGELHRIGSNGKHTRSRRIRRGQYHNAPH